MTDIKENIKENTKNNKDIDIKELEKACSILLKTWNEVRSDNFNPKYELWRQLDGCPWVYVLNLVLPTNETTGTELATNILSTLLTITYPVEMKNCLVD